MPAGRQEDTKKDTKDFFVFSTAQKYHFPLNSLLTIPTPDKTKNATQPGGILYRSEIS
jgi:hypothetical protein